jgi:hypothetical protein
MTVQLHRYNLISRQLIPRDQFQHHSVYFSLKRDKRPHRKHYYFYISVKNDGVARRIRQNCIRPGHVLIPHLA